MEKPLLPLALVSLAVGLVLISVAIGSQKTGKRAQKDPFACLLDAHGRCRHVDHREPTRMTLHAAARLPAIGRGQSTGPLCHSRNRTTGRFQAPETLGTMTTIIMRTSHDNSPWSFLALFQGFRFFGKSTDYPRSPRSTYRHPRIISTDSHPTGRPPSAGTLVPRGVDNLVRLKHRASR